MTELNRFCRAPTALAGFWTYKSDSRFPSPLGLGRIFQGLRDKQVANRAYKRAVNECLAVLFCGFPDGLLPLVKDRVAVSSLCGED